MVTEIQNKKKPAGYKQTEVGVIPENWSASALLKCCTKITDGTHDTPKPVRSGIPFLTAIHVKDNWIDFDSCLYVTEADHAIIFSRCNPAKGDVLMVNIGAGVATTALVNVDYEFSLKNVALLKPDSRQVVGAYLNYALAQRKSKITQGLSSGGAQPFLSLTQIGEIEVPLPPSIAEQDVIASVLSNADALIENLNKLIAKKRAIKQGAMQELLTGKRRLLGFKGKWAIEDFNNTLRKIGTKFNQIQTHEYVSHGSHPVIDQGQSRIVAYSNDDSKLFKCPEGGVIVFGDHTRIIKFIDFNFVVGADGTQVLGVQNGFFAKFMYYQLLVKEIPSTGYNRHFKFLKEMTFFRPSYEEQTVIASVLSDMDVEIEALEQKLAKYKALKQGMMQVLLTGKIRLPH